MDELTIDDKKYVSSKRAALITGYAKDYVGQLAREGYVEARRVGRSWYVLESAIKDHRFGNERQSEATKLTIATIKSGAAPVSTTGSTLPPTWESPRYESVPQEEIPPINLLRRDIAHTEEKPVQSERQSEPDELDEAWQTWFQTYRAAAPVTTEPPEAAPHAEEAIKDPESEIIPIHALPDTTRHTPARLSHAPVAAQAPTNAVRPRKRYRKSGSLTRSIMFIWLYLLMLVSATLSVFGTGYFDHVLISNTQAAHLAGITIFEK